MNSLQMLFKQLDQKDQADTSLQHFSSVAKTVGSRLKLSYLDEVSKNLTLITNNINVLSQQVASLSVQKQNEHKNNVIQFNQQVAQYRRIQDNLLEKQQGQPNLFSLYAFLQIDFDFSCASDIKKQDQLSQLLLDFKQQLLENQIVKFQILSVGYQVLASRKTSNRNALINQLLNFTQTNLQNMLNVLTPKIYEVSKQFIQERENLEIAQLIRMYFFALNIQYPVQYRIQANNLIQYVESQIVQQLQLQQPKLSDTLLESYNIFNQYASTIYELTSNYADVSSILQIIKQLIIPRLQQQLGFLINNQRQEAVYLFLNQINESMAVCEFFTNFRIKQQDVSLENVVDSTPQFLKQDMSDVIKLKLDNYITVQKALDIIVPDINQFITQVTALLEEGFNQLLQQKQALDPQLALGVFQLEGRNESIINNYINVLKSIELVSNNLNFKNQLADFLVIVSLMKQLKHQPIQLETFINKSASYQKVYLEELISVYFMNSTQCQIKFNTFAELVKSKLFIEQRDNVFNKKTVQIIKDEYIWLSNYKIPGIMTWEEIQQIINSSIPQSSTISPNQQNKENQ